MIHLILLIITLWLLLMVLLQSMLNRRVWKPYQYGVLIGAIATLLTWPGVGK